MNVGWQDIVVLASVAVAAIYLAQCAWRRNSKGHGGCDGCPAAGGKEQPRDQGTFVPVDSLLDSAKK